MKIIATDNNYGLREGSGHPAWYLLTHSCLQRDNKPLYVPDWDADFRLFPSMAVRIDRLGKSIAERFAYRYWDHWSFGFSLRGVDTLRRLREQGFPQGEALAFDCSAIIAPEWLEVDRTSLLSTEFSITDGDNEICCWKYSSLALGADALIEHLSRRMTFKTGDILYLGFPSEGIPLQKDMKIIVNKNINSETDTIFDKISGFNIKTYPN